MGIRGAGRPRGRTRYRRASSLDRALAPTRIVAFLGPIAHLDEKDVTAKLRSATACSARLFLQPTVDSRWTYRSAVIDGAVHVRSDVATADLGDLLTCVHARPGPRLPLEVFLCDDYVVLDYSHGLGDGQLGMALLSLFAGSAAPPARALAADLPRNAVWAGLLRHYRKNPASAVQSWALRREHRAQASREVGLVRAPEDWAATKHTVAGYLDAGKLGELNDWTAVHAPGATRVAVTTALWVAALRDHGLTVDPTVSMAMNCRRYLSPEYHSGNGNFAVVVPVYVPSASPADINVKVRRIIESGWPIAMMGVGDLLGRLPRSSVRPPTEAQLMPDRLRLVVSDMGRPAIFEHVTWTGLRPPQGGAFVDPDGPDAVTLLVSDLQGGRTFTAAYSSAMVSPAVMRDVVDSICANPVALLEDSRV